MSWIHIKKYKFWNRCQKVPYHVIFKMLCHSSKCVDAPILHVQVLVRSKSNKSRHNMSWSHFGIYIWYLSKKWYQIISHNLEVIRDDTSRRVIALTQTLNRLAAQIFIFTSELTTISHKMLKIMLWCSSNVLHHVKGAKLQTNHKLCIMKLFQKNTNQRKRTGLTISAWCFDGWPSCTALRNNRLLK